jgi:TrmH family RNA methyltransferase
MSVITSVHNPLVRSTLALSRRAERDARRLTVVEGVREVLAAVSRVTPETVLVCRERLAPSLEPALIELDIRGCRMVQVSPAVFERLAYRDDSGGVVLVVPAFAMTLSRLSLPSDPLVLVLDGVEKPGNVGAILRTADAAGASAVVVTGEGTDLHNPNVIRASLGAVFTVPVAQAGVAETVSWCRAKGLRIVAADPAGADVFQADVLDNGLALVLGSEARGISHEWRAGVDATVAIPMRGHVDSLNVSAAAAVLLFEAARRRRAGSGSQA